MQTLSIRQIIDPKDPCLPLLCQWLMDWWGHEEGFTKEKMASYIGHSLCKERIPQTIVLYLGDTPIGMYQFSMTDIDVRPDLYPWLANVYLDPAYRNRGYGTVLMEHIRNTAREGLPFQELFLYTTHTELYERYGWDFVSEIDTFLEHNRMQRLYRLDLRRNEMV